MKLIFRITFFLVLLSAGTIASAQNTVPAVLQDTPVYADESAEFPGGEQALNKFIRDNLKYPIQAIENEVSGRVIVKFTVDTTGHVRDIQIVKGLGFGCDEEVIRIIKLMPEWKPAKRNNQKVPFIFTLPVKFTLL